MFTMCIFTACGERVESITLDTSKVVKVLDYNQDLDLSKLIVTANYAKESKTLKSSEYTVDKGGFDKTVAGSYTITISYANKSANFDVVVNPNIQDAVGVKLKTEIATKEFEFGASYSSFGLGVYAVFEGGEKYKLSDNQYTIDSSAYNANVAGTYTIVVTLKDVLYNNEPITASYNVTVKPAPVTLTSLRLDTTNVKTEFEWGEQFTCSGLKVYRVYSDGSEKLENTVEVNAMSFKSNVAGTYNIIVSVKNGATNFFSDYSVVVKARPSAVVTDIELDVTTNNVKTTFEYGESFTSSGLVVSKVMSYGDPEIALPSEYTVDNSAFNSRVAGTYTIVVTLSDVLYNNEPVGASYDVTVNASVQNGIALDTTNVKTTYYLGEELTLENLTVSKTYANTTFTEFITSEEYNVNNGGFDNTVAGTYTITITQKDSTFSKTFDVTVLNETKILRLEVSNAKNEFEWGEEFDASGIVVKKVLSLGEPVTLGSGEYTINSSAYDKNTAGSYVIIVSLNGTFITTNYNVTVGERPAPVVVGITLNTDNAKTVFAWGEEFDATGLVVLKQMDYGNPVVAEESEYAINSGAFDKNTAGDYEITITLNNTKFREVYTVTVSAPVPVVENWSLNIATVKQNFVWGEEFDASGLVVVKEMNIGTVNAESSEYTIDSSEYVATTAGEYTIYVTCSDDTKLSYKVTVEEITSEQLSTYTAFKEIELTAPSGVTYKIPYKVNETEYEFVTFETGEFAVNITTNNNFVTVEDYQKSVNHFNYSNISFRLSIGEYQPSDFYLVIKQESPVSVVCIGNNNVYLTQKDNTFLINNNTYTTETNLEIQWASVGQDSYSWTLNGEVQDLNLVNMVFENNTTYTIEIISNATDTEFVLQTLTIKVVPQDIVSGVQLNFNSFGSVSFDKVDVDKYYATGCSYEKNYTFELIYADQNTYTITTRKEVANVVYGDNVFYIDINSGDTFVKTITVTYNYLFDITLDNNYFNTQMTASGVYAETYLTTLESQDYKYLDTNVDSVSTLNIGENNLIGIFIKDEVIYQFNAVFKVLALGVSSVSIDGVNYNTNDTNANIVIHKDFFSSVVVNFEYDSTASVRINGEAYTPGTDFQFTVTPSNNYLSIYVSADVSQSINISFLESTLIKEVSVNNANGANVVAESLNGYEYATDTSFNGVNVSVEEGYTYKIMLGEKEFGTDLKVGLNILQINIYDANDNLVEEKQFNLYVYVNLVLTDDQNTEYNPNSSQMTNVLSLEDFDITKKLNFGDDYVVSMNGVVISNTNIELTDDISKLSFATTVNGYTYSGDLYVYKADLISASDLFANLYVEVNGSSYNVSLYGAPCYAVLPITADINSCVASAEFNGSYSDYTYTNNVVDNNIVVTVYDANNGKVADIIIILIKYGIMANDTRAYYSVANIITDEQDSMLEDGETINISANTAVMVSAIDENAKIELSGVPIIEMTGINMMVFTEEGTYSLVATVTATDGTVKTYNVSIIVGPAQYAFEIEYAGQNKKYGGFERDDSSFIAQDHDRYLGVYELDMDAIDTENGTVALNFTVSENFTLTCGDVTIVDGVNDLPYTEANGVYTVTITTEIKGSTATFELKFESCTTLATFTIGDDVRILKMYTDGNVSPAFIMQGQNSLMTVYKEDSILSNTTENGTIYYTTLSITNIASGYSVIDAYTQQPVADTNNITLTLQQQTMSGMTMYVGVVICTDEQNNMYAITFMFSDLAYLMQNMMM